MKTLVGLILVVVLSLPFGLCQRARADQQISGRRVALVIGNSAYRAVGALPNAGNDARLIASTLRSLGFDLVGGNAQLDLDRSHFTRAIQDFGRLLAGADVALFYYSGHGLQVQGVNWLVPIDANPGRPQDLDFQMVDADLVMRQMDGAGTRLNVILLDACRNNPFSVSGLRALQGGLAEMRAPEGTLISYATQPGNVAIDGAGADSPYTTALAAAMRQPGVDIFRMINQVGLEVKRGTGGAQQPWVSTSPIDGEFFFAGPAQSPPVTAPGIADAVASPANPEATKPVPPAPAIAGQTAPQPGTAFAMLEQPAPTRPAPGATSEQPAPQSQSGPAASPPDMTRPAASSATPATPADALKALQVVARAQPCSILEARDAGSALEIRGLAGLGPQWDSFVSRLSTTRGIRLAGSGVDLMPAFACGVIEELGNYVRRTREASGRMLIPARHEWVVGGSITVTLHDVAAETVLLDLYRADGTVEHLSPSHRVQEDGDLRITTKASPDAVPGRQVMSAIVIPNPVTMPARPNVEAASTYFAALRAMPLAKETTRADLAELFLRPASLQLAPQPVSPKTAASPAQGPRCGSILERAQLGEPLTDAERTTLRTTCH